MVNIIRMVSGYLQAAYSYSPADAQVLARFVVYYNAVFRGNLAYLGGVVQDHRHGQRHRGERGHRDEVHRVAGKDAHADPHSPRRAEGEPDGSPGRAARRSAGRSRTSRSSPGKALPERKDLTELQQRGIEENQQKAADQQKQLEADQQKLADEQKKR